MASFQKQQGVLEELENDLLTVVLKHQEGSAEVNKDREVESGGSEKKPEFRSGERYSRHKANVKQRVVDSLARLLAIETNSRCAAVYLDEQEPVAIVAQNEKTKAGSTKSAWEKIFRYLNDEDELYLLYQKRLILYSTKQMEFRRPGGYASLNDIDCIVTLTYKFQDVVESKNEATYHEKNLTRALDILAEYLGTSSQKIRQKEIAPEQFKLAWEAGKTCVQIFREWKDHYKTLYKTPAKHLLDFLEDDNNLPSNLVELIRRIKPLVYSFMKIRTDLNRLRENSGLGNYIIVSPWTNQDLHAELKIIFTLAIEKYLDSRHHRHRIGISKLACAMCECVVETINHTYQSLSDDRPLITIRGWHGKVYDTWKFPKDIIIDSQQSTLQIWRQVLKEFCRKYQTGNLLSQLPEREEASTATSDTRGNSSCGIVRRRESRLNMKQAVCIMLNLQSIESRNPHSGFDILNQALYTDVGEKSYTPVEILIPRNRTQFITYSIVLPSGAQWNASASSHKRSSQKPGLHLEMGPPVITSTVIAPVSVPDSTHPLLPLSAAVESPPEQPAVRKLRSGAEWNATASYVRKSYQQNELHKREGPTKRKKKRRKLDTSRQKS